MSDRECRDCGMPVDYLRSRHETPRECIRALALRLDAPVVVDVEELALRVLDELAVQRQRMH